MNDLFSLIEIVGMFALLFTFPSFLINIFLLLIPNFKNIINSSFIYGGFAGIAVGGMIGLTLFISPREIIDVDFLRIYAIGFVSSLWILIPHILIFLLNKRQKKLNADSLFSGACLLYSIEILAAFALLNFSIK
ncbi:hypothetical protein [Helicobacter typhlonius]|uniref:hypothetical protein n=1 Tax=Helicobacter typhlonius TaxID=76936 RepID=UPI002FE0D88D